MNNLRSLAAAALLLCPLTAGAADTPARDAALEQLDPVFESFMRDNHVPGLVYGVVVDGKLIRVRGFGVQQLASNTPVTADSVFRIASMSKQLSSLAVLKLRDAGKLALDAPAENYIPELRRLSYPTTDSPKITVRDLLSHGAGFVTDDPWGDRQLDMTEPDFTRLLERGVPFSHAPGTAYEYSNFGYALVGRLITNVSRGNYADYVAKSFLTPLGMSATRYDVREIPDEHRAIGYRWENDAWREEPALGPGVFGAMGGLATSANDYARYVSWVLNAWPPRDGAEDGILRRASVREIARPANYSSVTPPPAPGGCPRSAAYGLGVHTLNDCVLGVHFSHSGGLPGFGSNVLFVPGRSLAVFAFANRTYAPASRAVREAANLLVSTGAFPERQAPLDAELESMAALIARLYESGDIRTESGALAMNFLLDHDATIRNRELADLKRRLGKCQPASPAQSDSAMSATFSFTCEKGTLAAHVVLAPTRPATLQTLEFDSH